MKRKSPQQDTESFKKEAINLMFEQGDSVSQAANALRVGLLGAKLQYDDICKPHLLSVG